MQNLFSIILKMSVSAVPVILLVLCMRQLFKKYPKGYSFALWLVVFASLAVPFKVPVKIELPMEKATAEFTQTIVQEFTAEIQQGDIAVNNTVPETEKIQQNITIVGENAVEQNISQTAPVQQAQAAKLFTLQLWHIWLCGILVLLAFEIVNIKGIYDKTRFAFKKQGNIYLCDEINKPFVFGIVKPKIFLPSDISPQDEQYVTQHEQTHIARKDYIVKPLCFAIAAVHWFNPLVWLGFYLMEKDMELSCDEKVAKTLDTAGMQQYCTALLAFAVKDKPYKINAVLFGEGNCTMRIKNILRLKQPKKITAILLSLCVLFAGCTAFITEGNSVQNSETTQLMNIENLESGKTSAIALDEYADIIEYVLSAENWQEGTGDCICEYKITFNGEDYYYHSDCGTLNDNKNNRSITLDESLKAELNSFLADMTWTENTGEAGFNYKDLWVKESEAVDILWFSDATFVGDSMTEGLRIYTTIANSVGDIANFVSARNLSPAKVVEGIIDNFDYMEPQNGIEAIAATNPEKIYFSMGTNALVEMSEKDFLAEYVDMLKTAREKFPKAQIYVTSVSPVTKEFTENRNLPIFRPENLQYVNGQLAQIANNNGAYYLNLHEVLAGDDGYLKEEYANTDGMHLVPDAYTVWVEYLMTHTVDESEDIRSYPKQEYFSEETETETDTIIETETEDAVYYDAKPISLPNLEAGKYVFPVDMANENIRISRGYSGQYPSHDGIDIAGPYGTEIFASADGKVIKAEESTAGDGNHVVIEHANGYYTLYGHCSELLAKVGDEVKQGDVIAKMGSTGNSTGNHLHFEFGFGYGSEPNGGLSLDPYNAVATRCAEDLNGVSISGEYQQSSDDNSTAQTNDENEQYYAAQAGDSPISIAKAHNFSVDELYAMNPDIKEKGVFVGDKIRVTQMTFGWPIGESPTGEGVRISRGFVGQYPEHNGVDIAGPKGTDILASADGIVIKAYNRKDNYGNYIVIQHTGGYRTLYAHCSELLVKMGDYVNKGDVIAKMGSTGNATGNQLHFEIILENDTRIDPYTKW